MKNGMKILVVDDSSLMRGFAKDSLKQLNLKDITEAGDGAEALAVLKNGKFDLILSDLHMPNMDGLELLNTVKSDSQLKNIPFIILTLDGKKDTLIEAVKGGLNNYLIKPVTASALDKALKKVFP